MANERMRELEMLLQEWARLANRADDPGLGYPSQSVEYRMMREGPAGAAISSGPCPECGPRWPADIQLLDEAIRTRDTESRALILLVYRKRARRPWELAEMSRAAFYQRMDRIRGELLGFMDARGWGRCAA